MASRMFVCCWSAANGSSKRSSLRGVKSALNRAFLQHRPRTYPYLRYHPGATSSGRCCQLSSLCRDAQSNSWLDSTKGDGYRKQRYPGRFSYQQLLSYDCSSVRSSSLAATTAHVNTWDQRVHACFRMYVHVSVRIASILRCSVHRNRCECTYTIWDGTTSPGPEGLHCCH